MKSLSVSVGLILLVAVGLQVWGRRGLHAEQDRLPLRAHIPAHVEGWTVADQPIAETAEMKKAVGELLNFDEAVFRTYRRGGLQFDVYTAYWKPGKMSSRLVAGHTPDVCWVAAGWSIVSRDTGVVMPSARISAPGQRRVFRDTRGNMRWVAFWHRAGGRLVDYGSEDGVPPWWSIFSDLKKHGLNQRQSQYFVRVSSNVSWDQLVAEPGVREVLATLEPILEAR